MTRYLDAASATVIMATLVLFVVALFLKGVSQAVLVEAGVFLVSAKLIIMSHRLGAAEERLNEKVDALQASVERLAEVVAARRGTVEGGTRS